MRPARAAGARRSPAAGTAIRRAASPRADPPCPDHRRRARRPRRRSRTRASASSSASAPGSVLNGCTERSARISASWISKVGVGIAVIRIEAGAPANAIDGSATGLSASIWKASAGAPGSRSPRAPTSRSATDSTPAVRVRRAVAGSHAGLSNGSTGSALRGRRAGRPRSRARARACTPCSARAGAGTAASRDAYPDASRSVRGRSLLQLVAVRDVDVRERPALSEIRQRCTPEPRCESSARARLPGRGTRTRPA